MTAAGVLVDQQVNAVLSGERSTVKVSAEALAAPGAEAAGDERYGLYLDGLDFGRPGAYFEVYANLPKSADPDPDGRYYIGNLGHFGPTGETGVVGYEITELVAHLRSEGAWSGDLNLTFVRRGLEGEAAKAELVEPGDPVRFSNVRVVRE